MTLPHQYLIQAQQPKIIISQHTLSLDCSDILWRLNSRFMHKTRNDIFDRQALTGYSGLPCRGVYFLLSLLPRRTDSIPRYYLVATSTMCLEMVKIATKSHIAHKPFAHIQKFHSVLESYLIKWKDTVKKNKTKQKDIQVNSNNQILWKGFCKLVVLQGFAALLNSLLMDKHTQVATPRDNLSHVHVRRKRQARWSDLPLPTCLVGSLCVQCYHSSSWNRSHLRISL